MPPKLINNELTENDHIALKRLIEIAGNSTCTRAKVASLIMKDGKILIETNNNTMPKFDCNMIGCIRDIREVPSGSKREICYGLCAEQYLMAYAAKEGIAVKNASIYVTTHPCRICECLIASSGISRVIYVRGYPDVLPQFDPFKKYNVDTIHAGQYDTLPKPFDV
jgi:dCMP deaminase